MSANFKKGMGLTEISADQFNRMQSQLARPRPGGTLDRRNNRYEPLPNIILGVNNTADTLVDGSIVVLGSIHDGGIISRRAAPDVSLSDRNNIIYNLIPPEYPQPEPDEYGEIVWPYPEQRMVVVQTTVPVQPGDRCYAILFGKAIVTVKLNDYSGDIPYKYATFIDGNTEMLQSATSARLKFLAIGADTRPIRRGNARFTFRSVPLLRRRARIPGPTPVRAERRSLWEG